MRRGAVVCVTFGLILLVGASWSQPKDDPAHVVPYDARTPAEQKKAFKLPAGFDIELVAAEPDIHKPMNIAFDAKGRLWVTDTVEYPYPIKEGAKSRDTVKILEDFGPDGKARKITTFAENLNIPIGLQPFDDSALVFSIPHIMRFSDTKNAGKADKSEVVYQRYGMKDTHGLTNSFTWGFDGWVYACHGFNNDSTVEAKDGSKVSMNSGNTYRFRPDGSHIEQYTWGQVNPFGMAIDPLGNLYTADCHSRPLYQLLRGAYYPSFGKPHDGLGYAPDMLTHDHGSTGIAGACYYTADHFPPEYRDTIFIGNVITNRINHDKLDVKGATRCAIQQPDFLQCSDRWFRPVDIKLGPDGALYIADFYNRIIGHYEVPLNHPLRDRERGRIWRIVYRGPDGKGKPSSPRADWTKASVKELVEDMAHPNLTVRLTATHQLVARGAEAEQSVLAVMGKDANEWQRVHGMWVLERLNKLDDKTLETGAAAESVPVRVHVQRVLAERARWNDLAGKLAVAGLKDRDANVQRAAADALGQHPTAAYIRPLLDLRHAVAKDDTHLKHVVRMALRNQLKNDDAWKELPISKTDASKDEDALADVALGVHTEASARYLVNYLTKQKDPAQTWVVMAQHVARYGSTTSYGQLVEFTSRFHPRDLRYQVELFRAVEKGGQEGGKPLSKEALAWGTALCTSLLANDKAERVLDGIKLAASVKLKDLQPKLTEIAQSNKAAEAHRLAAMDSLVALDVDANVGLLGKLLANGQVTMKVREHAANTLGRLNRNPAFEEMIKGFQAAPAGLQKGIALAMTDTPAGAERLLQAVADGKASGRLLQDLPVQNKLKARDVPKWKDRVAELTKGLPAAEGIDQLMAKRREGYGKNPHDIEAGKKAFQTHCAACHQIANQGSKVGPQLDGIGNRGLERLLEDTLDPNRNVDQAFRTTVIELKSGQSVSGLLVKTEGMVLVLVDGQGKEIRVEKKDIDMQFTTQQSPMPPNLIDKIPEADYYHLLAYLLSLKPMEK